MQMSKAKESDAELSLSVSVRHICPVSNAPEREDFQLVLAN